MKQKTIVNNKKAHFDYTIENEYICGLRIKGTEIKSIRNGDCSISESFCFIDNGEIFVKNMFIKKYEFGSHSNHDETVDRKLLLNRNEITKISKKVSEKGYSLIPLRLLLIDGWAKLEIGLGKGNKNYEKKEKIKEKDLKRDLNRNLSINI